MKKYQIILTRDDAIVIMQNATGEDRMNTITDRLIHEAHSGIHGIGCFELDVTEIVEDVIERTIRKVCRFHCPSKIKETA